MQAKSSSDPSETDGLVKVNKILTVIPVLFIILRAWSTVQYIYTNSIAKYHHNGCIPTTLKAGYLTFGILQVIIEAKCLYSYICLTLLFLSQLGYLNCKLCLAVAWC